MRHCMERDKGCVMDTGTRGIGGGGGSGRRIGHTLHLQALRQLRKQSLLSAIPLVDPEVGPFGGSPQCHMWSDGHVTCPV